MGTVPQRPAPCPESPAVLLADEQSYLLRDAEAEVLFSFSLEESLKRAHVSPLFKVTQAERPEPWRAGSESQSSRATSGLHFCS